MYNQSTSCVLCYSLCRIHLHFEGKKIVYDPEMWKLLLCLTFIVSVVGNVWLWEKNEKREHCDNFFYKYIGGETEIK